jgi:hypothetical protein
LQPYHLVSGSQPPAYIDQCRGRAEMRNRPRHGNVADVRWVVYHQLRDNVESKEINHLSVRGRNDLRESSGKGKSYISSAHFDDPIKTLQQLELTYLGSSPSEHSARFVASMGGLVGCRYASLGGHCHNLLRAPWLGRRQMQHLMHRRSRRGRWLTAREWRGRRLWLLSVYCMLEDFKTERKSPEFCAAELDV